MTDIVTRPERIAQELRAEILRGTWKVGERLPGEREIASRLGVHRSSVREALKKLEQLRLVVIRRGGGTTVGPLEGASIEVIRDLLFASGRVDPVLAQQLLDVRELLFAGATRLAVERASDETFARARSLVSVLAEPHASDEAFFEASEALVDLLVEATGNFVLRLVRNAVHSRVVSHPHARRNLRPPIQVIAPLARAIDAAFIARDADAAEGAVRRYLRATQTCVLRALEAARTEDADESLRS